MGKIFIGTSSFADKSVIPYFYPKTLAPKDRLSYYARFFNTVEIDSSFYGMPSERNSLLFASRTPDDFIIHFKAFRLMTLHPTPLISLGRTLISYLPSGFDQEVLYGFPNEELKEQCFRMFWLSLMPLKNTSKLGYLLFQFPPWFKKNNENLYYLYEIRNLLPDAKIAIEFRNGTWLLKSERNDTFSILRELKFAFVIVDEPQVGIYGSIPTVFEVTDDNVYFRFHGRNRDNWLKKGVSVQERFRYLYSEEELKPFADGIGKLKETVENVYLLFNNCFAYYALKNARMLADMLNVLEDREPLKIFMPSDEQDHQLF
ncbi:MAG: DUF72 domain-containing protein [Actinobacteria bacterium]|nr:DUF72 domain-containing protein [Actinomycetota bacterium]